MWKHIKMSGLVKEALSQTGRFEYFCPRRMNVSWYVAFFSFHLNSVWLQILMCDRGDPCNKSKWIVIPVSVACPADAAAALIALEGILSYFRLCISKARINLAGVRGMGRTHALLIRLVGSVLFLHAVLLLLEVRRSCGCTSPAGSYQKICRRMHRMGKLFLSNNLLGNCRITFAEIFSLFWGGKNKVTEKRVIFSKTLDIFCYLLCCQLCL